MSGRATFTIVRSSRSMKTPVQTAASVDHLRLPAISKAPPSARSDSLRSCWRGGALRVVGTPRSEPNCFGGRTARSGLGERARSGGGWLGERGGELGARLRVLQLGRRAVEHLHRLAEQFEPAAAALDESGRAQGGAERARRAPGAGELELLGCESAGLVELAQLLERERGLGAPGDEGGVSAFDGVEAA